MTEFWVSTAKHWCKFCGTWLTKSAHAIRHHETGKRHKEAVQEWHTNRRNKKEQASREKDELQRAIAKIEAAAQQKLAGDATSFVGGGGSTPAASRSTGGAWPRSSAQSQPPPPPPRQRTLPDRFAQRAFSASAHGDGDDVADDGSGLGRGRYVVRGVTFLEGLHFERLLVLGCRGVEVWSDADDEWRSASIERCVQTAVPNTTIVLRRYSVRLVGAHSAAPPLDVMSDQVRLRVAPPPPPPPRPGAAAGSGEAGAGAAGEDGRSVAVAAAEAEEAAGPPDLFGFGQWRAAPVTVVADDDGDEEPAAVAAGGANGGAARGEVGGRASAHSETSTSVLNPFGGAYRGFDLDSGATDDIVGDDPNGEDGAPAPSVCFRKRKKKRGRGGAGSKRARRVELDAAS